MASHGLVRITCSALLGRRCLRSPLFLREAAGVRCPGSSHTSHALEVAVALGHLRLHLYAATPCCGPSVAVVFPLGRTPRKLFLFLSARPPRHCVEPPETPPDASTTSFGQHFTRSATRKRPEDHPKSLLLRPMRAPRCQGRHLQLDANTILRARLVVVSLRASGVFGAPSRLWSLCAG